jgi:endo-1,4-beta-D-glucanase Y
VKRVLLAAALAALAAGVARGAPPPAAADPCAAPAAWPHWRRYVEAFVQGDGRILDRTAGDRSTSEGQAYALFFALVANDRALFERILRWTEDNLAGADLRANLPAWLWGKDRSGRWGVLDRNPASDADLWLAYALLEAGRLWSEPQYADLARSVLENVRAREIADLPGLGPMLLPGPRGFALDRGRGWRLNPSYLPPPVLRRFASAGIPGPWEAILAATPRLVRGAAPKGAVADWVLLRPRGEFAVDPVRGAVGSYDAIRTYLWIGVTPVAEPVRGALAEASGELLRIARARGPLPEKVDVRSLRARGQAPIGVYAALLPLAIASGDRETARALDARVDAAERDGLYGHPPAYYDQNLVLFGRGFAEGRYRFDPDGGVVPAWSASCQARAR